MGRDLDFHITEWNIKASNIENNGVKSLGVLVGMVENMVELDVVQGAVWPIVRNTTNVLGGTVSEGIVHRESLIDPVNFLVDNAEDPYDAVRAWTWQQRQRELNQECEEPVVTICAGFGG